MPEDNTCPGCGSPLPDGRPEGLCPKCLLNLGLVESRTQLGSNLTPGIRLGPYEIREQIGKGGMGEVYRATDTRLDRTVAIKVLPEHLASDPQRRERFEREAKAVSSLNHPHICTLYDVGEQGGTRFLVMELVEGQTLAERLQKGRLPLDQALEYATQIADALDKAHREGVIHRDLKPGNIMLTKAGVKLLDFGLAKLQRGDGAVSSDSEMPTEDTAPLTAEGTILGTLQYMAPEQLEGRDADARTDVFAFGSVVYEMVTGQRAFEGGSQASLIGAILKDDPEPMVEIQPTTPSALERIVRKCLAKSPDIRWQTARDMLDNLGWLAEDSGRQPVIAQATDRKALSWALIAGVPLLVAALAIPAFLYFLDSAAPDAVSFQILPPDVRSRTCSQVGIRPACRCHPTDNRSPSPRCWKMVADRSCSCARLNPQLLNRWLEPRGRCTHSGRRTAVSSPIRQILDNGRSKQAVGRRSLSATYLPVQGIGIVMT